MGRSATAGHDAKGDAVVEIREMPPTAGPPENAAVRSPGGTKGGPGGSPSDEATAPSAGGRTDRSVCIHISSPVRDLFGPHQTRAVETIVREFDLHNVMISVTDNHALDWVLRARVRAAALRLRAGGGDA